MLKNSAPARVILSLAYPAILEAYLQNLLGVVDSFFIARLGLIAIDAVGVTNIYSMTYIGVFSAISTALSVFLARAVGAKQLERGRSAVWHGYLIAIVFGFLLSLGSIFLSVPLLHLMGATGELETTSMPYFKIVLGISVLIALFIAQSAAFRATGDTKTPLRVGFEMNILHVILDYVLIFGIGSIPGLGLKGAAYAMVLARLYASIRLWIKSRKKPAIALGRSDTALNFSLLKDMVVFAIPASMERLSMRLGQVLYFGLIVRMGIEVYATHNIAGNLTTFAYTIGGGFATAASVTIGQAIGEKNITDIESYRKWGWRLSAISMTLATIILCVTSPWLGLLYTHNKNVIHLLTVILAIDILSQPFLASVLIDTAAIQAEGNSKYPMMVTTIGIWGIRTLGIYVFAWYFKFGLPAVWLSIGLDNLLRAALFLRYKRKRNLAHILKKYA
ncbi:MAG TPA: MATE family efflux transporter [Bacillota bacterium]|nr:MATE family efflux transporter [Bacillota bacterium]